MGFFYRVSSVLLLNLILVHARPENLFSSDSIQPTLDAPLDDASPLWSSDEFSSGSTTNPLDQDASFMSDIDSFDNSNNLFASNSIDLTALPSCESEGSLTDGVLQARDGASCLPKDTPKDIINLPIELFQDPEAYLRNNLGTPPTDQKNQPGQGNMQDEDMKSVVTTSDFQQDEESCPTEIFGPSNIPVCRNPFTGRMVSEVSSYAVTLYNVIPYTPACLKFSMLFCCAILTSREFLPEEAIDPSKYPQDQLEFLSHLGDLAYDARYCWWKDLVLMINIPLDVIEGDLGR